MKKKYRWNYKKCFRNVASLIFRFIVVLIALCILGINDIDF